MAPFWSRGSRYRSEAARGRDGQGETVPFGLVRGPTVHLRVLADPRSDSSGVGLGGKIRKAKPMRMAYCVNCGQRVAYKRALGWGTFFMLILTLGTWFFLIPFYPLRCLRCGEVWKPFGQPFQKPEPIEASAVSENLAEGSGVENRRGLGYWAGAAIGRLFRGSKVESSFAGPMCPRCNVPVRVSHPICPKCGQRVRISRPA